MKYLILFVVLGLAKAQTCGNCCPNGIYRKHPTDCSKYIVCNHGVDNERDCSSGLHWNNESQACDNPCSAGCDSSIAERCKNTCPGGPYKSHPSDCRKYIVCNNGIESEMTCSGGLYWNDNAKICDFPCNSGCKQSCT